MQRKRILVTGAAGFLGRHFLRLLENQPLVDETLGIDSFKYTNIPEHLKIASIQNIDIRDRQKVTDTIESFLPSHVVHFAAETHVDDSIKNPHLFFETNSLGTLNILETCKSLHQKGHPIHFHHISTDEVYGSLGPQGSFTELSQYKPRSPYAASKASADHLVMSFFHTYGLNVTISNSSNNYGPFQFSEKFIPTVIRNLLRKTSIPIYGDGTNIRDWIHASDHSRAVWAILQKSDRGMQYNIGGSNEISNIDLAKKICDCVSKIQNVPLESLLRLLTFTTDRLGHDKRYSVNCSKIKSYFDWDPQIDFSSGLADTIKWYSENPDWP